MKASARSPQTYTLREIAERWGASHSSVLSLVLLGELRAIDISTFPAKRSRYIVRAEDLDEFERRRTTKPPEAPAPRRRRLAVPAGGVIEFFE